ncbi:hypothetical protein Rsub_02128 [Raphidocelis subcapitata]|uniref:Uncharacterized protein n=1 Tax=Raphidocelis subcapitata TaxID=307507 RepID=A0A2V0NNS7_9CHLO|nr:hypothetical protein Rsub_02128 [Raphidocelis subcapitata]|eukprot:GBF89251.1 hypothetical protein Rsub_02128 [Raphidocelis subcapitata]
MQGGFPPIRTRPIGGAGDPAGPGDQQPRGEEYPEPRYFGDAGGRPTAGGQGSPRLYESPKARFQLEKTPRRAARAAPAAGSGGAALCLRGPGPQPPQPAFCPEVDAVVCLQCLAKLPPDGRAALLSEAARALRPGGALIFVERAAGGAAGAPPLRAIAAGGGGEAVAMAELERLRAAPGAAWKGLQFDLALEGTDPHALGVAIRSDAYGASLRVRSDARAQGGGGGGARGGEPERRRERERRKPTAKGF